MRFKARNCLPHVQVVRLTPILYPLILPRMTSILQTHLNYFLIKLDIFHQLGLARCSLAREIKESKNTFHVNHSQSLKYTQRWASNNIILVFNYNSKYFPSLYPVQKYPVIHFSKLKTFQN